jgi:hypothetical protein
MPYYNSPVGFNNMNPYYNSPAGFNDMNHHHHHHVIEAAAANTDAEASDAVTERAPKAGQSPKKASTLERRSIIHGIAHGIHEEHDRKHHPHGHAPPYSGAEYPYDHYGGDEYYTRRQGHWY